MPNFLKKIPINNTALILIDAQAKIINPVKDKELIVKNILKILKAYEVLGKNIYISEQNPLKLGSTVKELIPNINYMVIKKMEFSLINSKELNADLLSKGINKLIICGFETHICILQSVLDFLKSNFEVHIPADSMGSRNISDHNIAIDRMTFEGAKLTSAESIIFELCETAERDEFKAISHIIKNN